MSDLWDITVSGNGVNEIRFETPPEKYYDIDSLCIFLNKQEEDYNYEIYFGVKKAFPFGIAVVRFFPQFDKCFRGKIKQVALQTNQFQESPDDIALLKGIRELVLVCSLNRKETPELHSTISHDLDKFAAAMLTYDLGDIEFSVALIDHFAFYGPRFKAKVKN